MDREASGYLALDINSLALVLNERHLENWSTYLRRKAN
jgi:hypothetical protein